MLPNSAATILNQDCPESKFRGVVGCGGCNKIIQVFVSTETGKPISTCKQQQSAVLQQLGKWLKTVYNKSCVL